jgi:AcrR family transcriptional regulator
LNNSWRLEIPREPSTRGRKRGGRKADLPVAENKRQQLVAAAYEIIVQSGFENLRTREIAARVGINIATLHYYFPTKEDLTNAVADYLGHEFATVHGVSQKVVSSRALTKLYQEFADARLYFSERRDMMLALQEFSLRAGRDPASKAIVERFYMYWKNGLKEVIDDGIKEGVFNASHDADSAALFVSSALSGALTFSKNNDELERIFIEVESWLVRK